MRWKVVILLWATGAVLSIDSLGIAGQPDDSDAGSQVFSQACAACHGAEAEGVPGSYPPLRGRIHKIANSAEGRKYLVAAVYFGLVGSIEVDGSNFYGVMPPHPQLSDGEIAAVLNYLDGLDATQKESPFTSKFVHTVRAKSLSSSDVRALRSKAVSDGPNKSEQDHAADPAKTADEQMRLDRLRKDVSSYQASAKTDFQLNCAGCHGFDGISPTPSVPSLKDRAGNFLHLERGRHFLVRVPGVSMSLLDDKQTARVLNWLLLAFSADQLPPDFRPYTPSEVHALRERPLTTKADHERAEVVAELHASGTIQGSTR